MRYLYILVSLFCLNATGMQAQEISASDREEIGQRILEMVNDFFAYIPEISGKGIGAEEDKQLGQMYIDKILESFLGECKPFKCIDENGTARCHVVRINICKGDKVKTLSLREYLTRLLYVPNGRIKFDVYEAFRIEEEPVKPVFVDSIRYLTIASVVLVQKNSDNDKFHINVKAYIQRKFVMTPEGEDAFWIVKFGDINIKEEE